MKKILIILILLLTLYFISLQEPPVKNINETVIGERIRVNGYISNFNIKGHLTFFKLQDGTGSINVVFFKKISGWNGLKVKVIGRVTNYKGNKELTGVSLGLLN